MIMVSTGAAKHRVRYKTGANDWNTVDVAAATRYTAEMLAASTTYRFEVSAYGDGATRRAGWGGWSMHLDASSDAAPTMSGCTTTLGSISGTSTLQGTWTDECVSSNRPGTRYARYFTFELATAAELTIELVSEIDPYLYLMAGAGTSGTELAKNDDSRDFAFGYSDSRITYEAAAGTYTAEATTYPATSTGDFTIRIDALSEPTEPTIVQATPGDGEIVVTWNEPDRTGGAAITDYQVQYGTAASGQARSVTDPSINWRLAGWRSASSARTKTIAGLTNGTTYYVAVQARNDIDPADGDGALSEAVTAIPVAPLMNAPPTFDQASYSLNVRRDAPSGHVVATVAAMDAADDLVYRMSGTTSFAIESDSGQITTSGLLLGLASASYDMTVYVSDGVNAEVSVPVTVTLDPSPIVLTISGLDGVAGTMAIGDDTEVTVEGSHLVAGVRYSLNVTTSDTPKLGFGIDCSLSGVGNLESANGSDSALFNLRACVPTFGTTVTATLNFSGTVVASATKTVNVRPALPTTPRANGHGGTATVGHVKIRVDKPIHQVDYKVRYEECDASNIYCKLRPVVWDEPGVLRSPTTLTFTVGSQQKLVHELLLDNLDPNTLYRVEVAAIVGGTNGERSNFTVNEVLVFTTHTRPRVNSGGANPDIATIPLNGYWSSDAYRPVICTDTFDGDAGFLPAVRTALAAWADTPPWLVASASGDDHNLIQVAPSEDSDCPELDDLDYPGTTEIRMAVNKNEFEEHCDPDEQDPMTLIWKITRGCVRKSVYSAPAGELPTLAKAYMFLRDSARYTDWLSGSPCTQLQKTIVHEAGHALGMKHATIDHALMYETNVAYCGPQAPDSSAIMGLYQSSN